MEKDGAIFMKPCCVLPTEETLLSKLLVLQVSSTLCLSVFRKSSQVLSTTPGVWRPVKVGGSVGVYHPLYVL